MEKYVALYKKGKYIGAIKNSRATEVLLQLNRGSAMSNTLPKKTYYIIPLTEKQADQIRVKQSKLEFASKTKDLWGECVERLHNLAQRNDFHYPYLFS